MQRRTLLKLGLGSAVVLAAAGGGLALLRPGLEGTKLSVGGRAMFGAVARAVLDGMLPAAEAARDAAVQAHLGRLDDTIAMLAPATRGELSQLVALLGSLPGRKWLAGLDADWPDASPAQVQAALQSMRASTVALRQQAYHALRDLTNAAYFADPGTWPAIGYPGPRAL